MFPDFVERDLAASREYVEQVVGCRRRGGVERDALEHDLDPEATAPAVGPPPCSVSSTRGRP
jgi:hypothetical protein